ncbi:MAG: dCTP deaminase, partial [Acidimicrobiales bacterium]
MILSDRTIREQLAAGRIVIDPLDQRDIQPSSVDLHIDRYFRVFRNHTMRVIDVKEDQEELTELVEIVEDDPFILHPGEFVLGSTLERVALPNDLVARLEGKALAVDTEVPTPSGWSTMGDLQPGDDVFHPSGGRTEVARVSEVMERRPCFEVRFSGGQRVVADAAHLWATRTRSRRSAGSAGGIVTTRRMAATLVRNGRFNHTVDLCGPVRYPDAVLPVDPYVLGVWLVAAVGVRGPDAGLLDGAEVATGPDVLDEIRGAGYGVVPGGRAG